MHKTFMQGMGSFRVWMCHKFWSYWVTKREQNNCKNAYWLFSFNRVIFNNNINSQWIVKLHWTLSRWFWLVYIGKTTFDEALQFISHLQSTSFSPGKIVSSMSPQKVNCSCTKYALIHYCSVTNKIIMCFSY